MLQRPSRNGRSVSVSRACDNCDRLLAKTPENVRNSRGNKTLFLLSIAVPLALYVGLAHRIIGAGIGYQMDEALYVESAVFLLHGTGTPPFVHEPASWFSLFGRRWPLMIIPYVGATKAYVALPLFAAFGADAGVARATAVLLGCVGIAGLVMLIGRQVGVAAGLVVGVLLAVHPSYLDFTVFDNGGVSVWMASMGFIAMALSAHLQRRTTWSAAWLGLAAGLGVWARANVAWLLASILVAAAVAFGRRAIPPLRHAGAMLAGAVVGVSPLLVYEVGSRLGTLQFMKATRQPFSGELFAQRLRFLADLMIADGEQRLLWSGPPLPRWELALGFVLLALVIVALAAPARGTNAGRWRRFFAAAAIVLAAVMLTSSLKIRQHHLIAVLPLAMAALGILATEISTRFRRATVPLVASGMGLLVLSLSWDVRIDRGLRRTGGTWFFSSAVNDAGAYLQSNPVPPDRLKILNWGFQNNLYVMTGGAVHGTELFWSATKELSRPATGTTWDAEIRDGGSFLALVDLPGPSPMNAASEGFAEALARYPGPRRETIFANRLGKPHVRLVEIAREP
jgi:hypothetical protein